MSSTPAPRASGGADDPPLSVSAVRSFLWAGLSFGCNRIVLFVMTLVLTRLLAPDDFGVVAAGLTVITLLEIALDMGLGAAVVYEQEDGTSDRVRTAFTLNVGLATLLAAAGVFAAPALASFFRAEGSVDVFRALFVYLVLRGAGQVQAAVLQRDLRFRERTIIDVARSSTRASVSIVLASTGAGAWSIVLGLLAGEVAGIVLASYYVRLLPAWRLNATVVATLLRFGLAVVGVKILSAVLTSSDKIIIGSRLGPEELGFYVIAFRLPELTIDTVGWIFSSVAFAVYSRARGQGMESFRGSMLKALRLTTLFGFSAGVGLAALAPIAVPVLFSEAWTPAVNATVYLALAVGLSSIGYASGDIFPAVGRPGTLLALNASTVPVAVLGFWFAAPHGIEAVALAYLSFQVAYCTLRLHVANRVVGTTWRQDLVAMRPAMVSAVGVAASALPASRLLPPGLLALALTVACGFAGALLALAVFSRPALQEARSVIRAGLRTTP